MEDELKTLKEKFQVLEKKVQEMEKNKTRYSNNEIFESSVTFQKPVYDRFGKRIIN